MQPQILIFSQINNMSNSQISTTNVGIDDMALYIPRLYLDIATLSATRNLPYAKLNKGLGLAQMAIPDTYEDAATMSANAIAELIDKNGLHPNQIGRIYLGTESALDGAKPTATYTLEMLEQHYEATYGKDCFLHCDVVDLTFACVGGVDALHNTIDWVNADQNRIGIVVCADNAKYELESTGEYTQGAGAVAMLVKKNPRLLAFGNTWGVATQGVHDFYKPVRTATKKRVLEEVLELAGVANSDISQLLEKLAAQNGAAHHFLSGFDQTISLHKETPIFDGQFSNQCYQNRIREAFAHFKKQAAAKGQYQPDTDAPFIEQWARLIFHLPYAFHGKRIFSQIFVQEFQNSETGKQVEQELGLKMPQTADFEQNSDYEQACKLYYRAVGKSAVYKAFVSEKLEKGQRASAKVGNMYAASIFLALMSTLEADFQDDSDLAGQTFGFFGYGSGSKSKVFEATIQPDWKEVVKSFDVFKKLNERKGLDYPTYHQLHSGQRTLPIVTPNQEFALSHIGTEGVTEGARYYEWLG